MVNILNGHVVTRTGQLYVAFSQKCSIQTTAFVYCCMQENLSHFRKLILVIYGKECLLNLNR